MQNKFFGSKLNSVLLLILIILMVITLYVMFQNKETYLPKFQKQVPVVIDNTQEEIPANVRNEILGNKDDLISFSIWPNAKVHGVVSYRGVISGGYFNEGNILINILDINKKVLKNSNAMTKSNWMTADPVPFEGYIDFTDLPKGNVYLEIHNDNPSDIREYDKSILIPIVID